MKLFLIGLVVVVLAVGGVFFYQDYYVKRKFRKLSEEKHKTVAPLIQRVANHQEVRESELLELAVNPSVRRALFVGLGTCKRLDLFPSVYLTYEKGAESSLVNWLEFPTELGVAPDEIEFIEKFTLQDEGEVNYYAFRYRMVNTHWAKKSGWMIGVAGPYQRDIQPYDIPRKVFSRFKTMERTSVKGEVEWVHENVNKV